MPRAPLLAASLLGLVACAPPADDTATWPGTDADVAWGNEDLSTHVDLAAPPAPLVLNAPQLLTVGGTTTIVLTGVKPSAKVTVYGSVANPSRPPACPSVLAGGCLGIAAPAKVLLTRTAGSSGTLSIPVTVPSPFGPAIGALQVIETRNGVTRLSNVDTALLATAGGDYDGDGSSNADEVAAGTDVRDADTDGDGALDGADECAFDAAKAEPGACGCGEPEVDVDSDGVCDDVDVCLGGDDGADADADGVADFCDVCPLDAPVDDDDGDGVCDSDDACVGDDAAGDPDGDGLCSDVDACPLDAPPDDDDGDGVCDADDLCDGDDALGDADGDGVCGSPPADLGNVVLIPAGTFTMGCVFGRDTVDVVAPLCGSDESPSRSVTLTRSFWMMESELTQTAWEGLGFTNPSSFDGSNKPVETVEWWEALEAANEASRRDGLPACYTLTGCDTDRVVGAGRSCSAVTVTSSSGHPKDCQGWRLPTEAEWEYAARGGEDFPYAGSDVVGDVAWHFGNNGASGTPTYGTKPVCTKARNGFGICDMSGNVQEWTWDYLQLYGNAGTTDPMGADFSPSGRMTRGGVWADGLLYLRVAYRRTTIPGSQSSSLGFRLVRSVP